MWTVIDSPVGELRLVAHDGALVAIEFAPSDQAARHAWPEVERDGAGTDPVLGRAQEQLGEYFGGRRREFSLPLAPSGTDFQRRVWAELARIGYGETASYGEIAQRLGMARGGSRAVGSANGRNPLPVVVPCHRVVGADGSLAGYAGGTGRKQTLLDLEQRARG